MRHRLMIVGLLVGGLFLLSACGDDGPAESGVPGLEAQSAEAGAVSVRVAPRQLDEDGAVFVVSMDTHEVELDADLTATATLTVDGRTWSSPQWSGDGAGGHHREGELRFEGSAPARGEVVLALGGFPEPVRLTWQLED